MKLKSFLKQCHKKEVFKMLSIYVVSAWVILQVLSVTWQPLGMPQKSVTYLIILLLLGFPIYIFYIWKIKLAPLEKESEALDEDGRQKKSNFQKMYFSALGIISMMTVLTLFVIINNNFSQNITLESYVETDKIAVLKFGNNTGDSQYDIVSKMAADWIIHGITENKAGQVISQEIINQYSSHLKKNDISDNENEVVKAYFKPGKIISGNFFLKEDKLLFQCALKDGETGRTIIAFKPTECNNNAALECIDELKESILGFLMVKDHKAEMLQETPPKYEAYQYVLEAKASPENENYLALLDNAINADSNYFEPKVLRVGYYYSIGNFTKADSLLKAIQPESQNNQRQLNLLNMYDALLKGNNKTAFQRMMEEYNLAPWDLKSNKSAMVVALQLVNHPEAVETMFEEIKMDSLDVQNCSDCIDRLYVKAYADIELNNYKSAINLLEPVLEKIEEPFLYKPLIFAYVKSENITKLNTFLNKLQLTIPTEQFQDLVLFTGKSFLTIKNKTKATEYFNLVINSTEEVPDKSILAQALFYKGSLGAAEEILNEIYETEPTNIENIALLAIVAYKMQAESKAKKYLETLEQLRDDYQFGDIDYALARYYAVSKNQEKFYSHLMKSVAAGKLYTSLTYVNDPLFNEFANTDSFKEAMTFWH